MYICYMKRKVITITEYAKIAGITRDAVYKQIYRESLPANVKVIKVAGQNFISLPANRIKENT